MIEEANVNKPNVNVPEPIQPTQPAPVVSEPSPKKFEFKNKKKSRSKLWILLAVVVLIIVGGLIGNYVLPNNNLDFEDGACEGSLFLGHCFDTASEYYSCNVEKGDCDTNTWNIVLMIRLFQESDVVIYGREGCIWCERQLDEFGIYADYLKENGLYIDCAVAPVTPIEECSDIRVTPTWKERGVIIYEGYLPLSEIEIRTG